MRAWVSVFLLTSMPSGLDWRLNTASWGLKQSWFWTSKRICHGGSEVFVLIAVIHS